MAMKAKGHALVKALGQGDNFFWRCECGVEYGAATADDRISREKARERHRVHLDEETGPMAAASEQPQRRD